MRRCRFGSALARTVAALFVLIPLGADFFASNPPELQDLDRFFAPPTRIRFVDRQGEFHWRPFVYGMRIADPLETVYEEDPEEIHPLYFFTAGYSYRFLGIVPCRLHLVGTREPGTFYPCGSDELGRDVLARVLAGARTSLLVVLAGVVLYILLGSAVGIPAGVTGGWLDSLLMRFSEFVLALPALYIILALRALLPPKLSSAEAFLLTTGTIAAVTWPPMARGIRGLIRQLRSAGYVEAARSLGCSTPWIVRRHILPALRPYMLQQTLVAAPVFLLGEIILSFLDVGGGPSAVSLGTMLRNLRDVRVLTDFWWNLLPLALVFLVLLYLNLMSTRFTRQAETRTVL